MYLLLRNYINSLGPIDSLARVTIITRLLDHQPSSKTHLFLIDLSWRCGCGQSSLEGWWGWVYWGELQYVNRTDGVVCLTIYLYIDNDALVLSLVLAVCCVLSAGLGWIFIRRELTDNFNGRWHQPTSGSSECVPIIPGLVSTSIIGINSNEPFLSTHQHSLSLVPIFNVMFQLSTVR